MDKLNKQELEQLRNIRIHNLIGVKFTGRKMVIRCMFDNHKDSKPSLLIDDKNGYHCFGCGKKGFGAIDFCKDLGLTFRETIEDLKKYL